VSDHINECYICGKNCIEETLTDSEGEKHPLIGEAVHFYATGNWASGVWDPLHDDLHLNIYICDACLVKHKQRAWVTQIKRSFEVEDQGPWTDWKPRWRPSRRPL